MRATLNEASAWVLSVATADRSVFEQVPVDLLGDPYRGWALVVLACYERVGQFDAGLFKVEAATRRLPAHLRWRMPGIAKAMAVDAFYEAYQYARTTEHIDRARMRMDGGSPAPLLMDELVAGVSAIPRLTQDEEVLTWSHADVLAMEGRFADWVVPGMLRHGHRLVLTGGEGWGKSTLIYQIAFGAAYGRSPLGDGTQFEPQRVYVLDVENWHETQVKAQYRRMQYAYRMAGVEPDVRLDVTRSIDLLQPFERRALIERVDRIHPDLVVMGSGYKLVVPTGDWRVEAQTVQAVADEIRARTGAAIILETHAGHGFQGDRNGWRPDGSSYWMRWPEFGIGLAPREPTFEAKERFASLRLLQVRAWRGARDTEVEWPYGWQSTRDMPFVPVEKKQQFEDLALQERD